jgi:hypothetical protein
VLLLLLVGARTASVEKYEQISSLADARSPGNSRNQNISVVDLKLPAFDSTVPFQAATLLWVILRVSDLSLSPALLCVSYSDRWTVALGARPQVREGVRARPKRSLRPEGKPSDSRSLLLAMLVAEERPRYVLKIAAILSPSAPKRRGFAPGFTD